MVVIPMLANAEFGENDYREDAPHFMKRTYITRIMVNYLDENVLISLIFMLRFIASS